MKHTDEVAIIIPTKNRIDFVLRYINFHILLKSKHTIFIGDASTDDMSPSIQKNIIHKPNSFLDQVNYFHYPDLGIEKTIQKLVNSASDLGFEYCAVHGDDDFIVPSTADVCVDFLNNNLEYHSAHGYGCIFGLRSSGAYGKIRSVGKYGVDFHKTSSEQDAAVERIREFSINYWVTHFAVHRVNEFIVDMNGYTEVTDNAFGELIVNYMSIANGKSKYIDLPYLIRQGHDARYDHMSFNKWINSRNYAFSYEVFIDKLSVMIKNKDLVSDLLSKEAAIECFDIYLDKCRLRKSKKLRYIPALIKKFMNFLEHHLPYAAEFIFNTRNAAKLMLFFNCRVQEVKVFYRILENK